jgi:hypothetical protein
MRAGIAAMASAVNGFNLRCPNTQLVIVGYSQGGQVADDNPGLQRGRHEPNQSRHRDGQPALQERCRVPGRHLQDPRVLAQAAGV